MKSKLIVYLADDHTVARKGLARLFKTFNRVAEVGDANNGKELIAICREREPDAVILDVEMPIKGGYETTRYVREHFPAVKILILTMHTEGVLVRRIMDAGAHGFLSKTVSPEEVERALYAVIDNDFYHTRVADEAKREAQDIATLPLSVRELEVLFLICQELSPPDIASRLQISEKTFFCHRASILAKTGAKNNIGIYKFALEHKLTGTSGKSTDQQSRY